MDLKGFEEIVKGKSPPLVDFLTFLCLSIIELFVFWVAHG